MATSSSSAPPPPNRSRSLPAAGSLALPVTTGATISIALIAAWVVSANIGERLFLSFPGNSAQQHGWWPDRLHLFGIPLDFQVYYRAGEAFLQGWDLYEFPFYVVHSGIQYILPYTYPPFASWLFSLMTHLPMGVAAVAWQVASLLCLWAIIGAAIKRSLPSLPKTALTRVALQGIILLTLIASFYLAPVRSSFFWGQINVFLMALVCADFLSDSRRSTVRTNGWLDDFPLAGVGVGLAAGLKLYPAFFGLLFLLQRRWRAAGFSAATAITTVLLGGILAPGYWDYWTDILVDTARFGGLSNPTSQSLKIWMTRELSTDSLGLWFIGALILTGLALSGAYWALRRKDIVSALGIIGLAACLISPFSWHHYYLWVLLLGISAAIQLLQRLSTRTRTHPPTLRAFFGFLIPPLILLAWWPYISVVFFAPWDIFGQMLSEYAIIRSSWVWWSALVLVVYALAPLAPTVLPKASPTRLPE